MPKNPKAGQPYRQTNRDHNNHGDGGGNPHGGAELFGML